jgi:Family of unknown function (DUF6529)
MEDLIEDLTRGNVSEVKIVLTSVVTALALYQVLLMLVCYGRLRLSFLSTRAASFTHRSSGDAIVAITVVVGAMCLGYFGLEDDAALHVVLGWLLAGALVLKIVVVRWWHSMSRFLPVIGSTVFALFVATWASSVGLYFWA